MLRLRPRRKPLDEMTSQEVLELAARAVIRACPGVLVECVYPDLSRGLQPALKMALPDGRRLWLEVKP
jgi:hypothetical protein